MNAGNYSHQFVVASVVMPTSDPAPEPVAVPTPDPVTSSFDERRAAIEPYLMSVITDDRIEKLAAEIIKRESGWKWWKCNETTPDGCGAGQGLFQVIPGTERGCEKNFGREMDMLEPRDNIDCGVWLLTRNGVPAGIGNWDSGGKLHNGKKWGSGPYVLGDFGL